MSFFFIQMADPQFGMFSSVSELTGQEVEERRLRGINVRKAPERITGFADETRLFTQAIEAANRLKPAFVVVCGDMTHDPDDEDQLAEVNRIKNLLDEDIPIHWVAGNHDVGDAPTEENLTRYRRRFGDDAVVPQMPGLHAHQQRPVRRLPRVPPLWVPRGHRGRRSARRAGATTSSPGSRRATTTPCSSAAWRPPCSRFSSTVWSGRSKTVCGPGRESFSSG